MLHNSIQTKILDIPGYSVLAGHSCERRVYDPLTREYQWHQMVGHVYPLISNCNECPRKGTTFNHRRKLELFPTTGSVVLVATDILKPLPGTRAGRKFVTIIINRYTALITAIRKTKITSEHAANIFFNDWTVCYGIPDTMLSDSGQQLVSRLITSSCFYLGTTELATTGILPKTRRQVEWNNKSLVLRLWMCTAGSQRNWDIFMQPLSDAYSC